ncbi:DNA cytosine methyltransferase [Aliarcobacter butzleri]|uniref:DNA cytosine methyltransferase n=1 Tax=Aliarcobacter butzleri TaxID=28197 RepID=UPI0021B415A2|nr:DNA cytosine methyltransferase [Aliarcobacter butzleri]MCT7563332.1 DNA cytosine methyltransferase [Aliarcobacter butzleri]MCT7578773.1 DNA cytosine methyltransferase [Aliarcobacter butzleri]
MSVNNTLNINIPQVATKQLKLQNCNAGKKLVVSTNWLPLFGFEANSRVKEELIGIGKGIKVSLVDKDDTKVKKVYTREYKSRRNNPIETMLDIRSQTLLNQAFPTDTEKVHIQFTYGEILITPMCNRKAAAIKQFKKSNNECFVACSSGVDMVSMVKSGLKVETLLEYRPNEARDKNDMTETGAINAITNVEVNHLINEDIMNLDIDKIFRLCSKSNYTNATISLQCDDFSNVKGSSLKDISLDDGSTSLDMVIDAINLISKFNFPTVLVENVPAFFTSDAGKVLGARLKRLGYKTYCDKFDARDYGGLTSRVRGYMFATMLPANFEMPKPTKSNDIPIWDLLNFDERIASGEFRDITHTSSLQDGLKTGRARFIKRDSISAPTVMKSQNRQAKDSVFIFDEVSNKYYFTSNKLLSELMGIKMDFSSVSGTIESEIIGQSIEVPLHNAVLESINKHLIESNQILSNRLF